MKGIRIDDRLSVPSKRTINSGTGQLIAECNIARTGVLHYKAKELGKKFEDLDPESLVRVVQLSDDLFSDETREKFRSVPVTIGHPEEDVNTENMKNLGKGMLEGKPVEDGGKLAANIVLSDKEAIDLVDAGISELSVRAYYKIDRVEGNADYDAIRTIGTVNHVAIVNKGRAGALCRISDEAIPEDEIILESTVSLVLDDEDTDNKDNIVAQINAVTNPDATKVAELEAELEAMKAGRIELETKLELAEAKAVTQEQIDVMVSDRMTFFTEAKQLSDVDLVGKSELEAKRAVVEDVLGRKLDDEDETHIRVRYSILLEDGAVQERSTPMSKELVKQSKTVRLSDEKKSNPVEEARQRMINRNKGVK